MDGLIAGWMDRCKMNSTLACRRCNSDRCKWKAESVEALAVSSADVNVIVSIPTKTRRYWRSVTISYGVVIGIESNTGAVMSCYGSWRRRRNG